MLVSIIIPAWNAERWLGAAVESALKQTYRYKEIIVVDDGSTDETVSVAKKFAGLISFYRQPNAGPSCARNAGLDYATGELIQFLDADDLLHSSRLETLVEILRASPDEPLVGAGYEVFHDHFVPKSFALDADRSRTSKSVLDIPYLPCAGLFRKSFLKRLGPWDSSLRRWVDLEFHSRIARFVRSALYVPSPLYYYRQHSGVRISKHNSSHTNLDNALRSLISAKTNLNRSGLPESEVNDCLRAFYLHLARGYGRAGNEQLFRLMLSEVGCMALSKAVRAKCFSARVACTIIGVKRTSAIIEGILKLKSQSQ